MGILFWILFGGLAGWFASILMKTNASQDTLSDITLGIVGSMVGGFLMGLVGKVGVNGFNFYSFVVAVIGAMVVIYIGRMMRNR